MKNQFALSLFSFFVGCFILISCEPSSTKLDNEKSILRSAEESLQLHHFSKSDSVGIVAESEVKKLPEVVGHLAVVDMRLGRQSLLILQLLPVSNLDSKTDTIKCDANQMSMALSILKNKDVLYDRATLTFIYSSQSYSFDHTLATK